MLHLRDYFVKTNIKISSSLVDSILSDVPNIKFAGNKDYAIDYSQPLMNEIVFDNQLDNFVKEFSAFKTLLKIDPFTHVPWHLDESLKRKSTINIVISNSENNSTYFTDAKQVEDLNYKKFNTWLCPYEYGVPVLVNVTNKLHCVFNCSSSHRLVLSICTEKIEYNDLIEWFERNGCIDG